MNEDLLYTWNSSIENQKIQNGKDLEYDRN